MRVKKDLLVGEWAVLALIAERPMHGYAIASIMAPGAEIGVVWTMSQPLVYRALVVLEEAGLAKIAALKPGRRAPRRTEMVATTVGKRKATRWLGSPEPKLRDLRSAFLLKLILLERRGRSKIPLLKRQTRALEQRIAELEDQVRRSDDEYPIVPLWRLSTAEAALGFVEQTLEHAQRAEA